MVWGWGQAATGQRAALVLAALEAAWLAAFVWFVPPLLDGGLIAWVFFAASAFIATWGASPCTPTAAWFEGMPRSDTTPATEAPAISSGWRRPSSS